MLLFFNHSLWMTQSFKISAKFAQDWVSSMEYPWIEKKTKK